MKISTLENKFKKNHFFLQILTDIPKKSVIFAHGLISLVILNFAFFDMLVSWNLISFKRVTVKSKTLQKAGLLVCNSGIYQSLKNG